MVPLESLCSHTSSTEAAGPEASTSGSRSLFRAAVAGEDAAPLSTWLTRVGVMVGAGT